MEKDSQGHIKENPIVSAAKYVLENTAKGARGAWARFVAMV